MATCDCGAEVVDGLPSYPRAARASNPSGTVIRIGDVTIGADEFTVMAGPCSIEDEQQIDECARVVAETGCRILRGGAFKPRTSPYSFQGLGAEGLSMIRRAADAHGLFVVTEIMDCDDLPLIADTADIVQIGSRTMMSYALLKKVARMGKPVLLKRNMAAQIETFLLGAEYLLDGGCCDVILCERGVISFDPNELRNTLDLASVALMKLKTHLPLIVDPSHGTGRRELVHPMSMGALAAGADGVIVEIHPDPPRALCDGRQSLDFDEFRRLVRELRATSSFLKGLRRSEGIATQ